MDYYKCYDNNIGYNINKFSNNCLGTLRSDETKKKMSKSKNNMSEETKIKMSRNNHCAKLNENDVINIKVLINNNIKLQDIANKYGVSYTNISRIKGNMIWKHVVLLNSDDYKKTM